MLAHRYRGLESIHVRTAWHDGRSREPDKSSFFPHLVNNFILERNAGIYDQVVGRVNLSLGLSL